MATDAQRLLKMITEIQPWIAIWASDERVAAEKRAGVPAGDMAVINDQRYKAVLDAAGDARAALGQIQALIDNPTLELHDA